MLSSIFAGMPCLAMCSYPGCEHAHTIQRLRKDTHWLLAHIVIAQHRESARTISGAWGKIPD